MTQIQTKPRFTIDGDQQMPDADFARMVRLLSNEQLSALSRAYSDTFYRNPDNRTFRWVRRRMEVLAQEADRRMEELNEQLRRRNFEAFGVEYPPPAPSRAARNFTAFLIGVAIVVVALRFGGLL